VVHTNHKNLTFTNFNSEKVMRWKLFIEECSPDLQYVQGEKNIVADALSQLEINSEIWPETNFTNFVLPSIALQKMK
jgi:hypothetical protein